MGWNSDSNGPIATVNWKYSATTPISGAGGFYRSNYSQNENRSLWYTATAKSFSNTKNYIYQTLVSNFSQDYSNTGNYYGSTMSIHTPWNSYFTYSAGGWNPAGVFNDPGNIVKTPIDNDPHILYFISKPSSNLSNSTLVTYKSTYGGFYNTVASTQSYIHKFNIYETDWQFKGHAFAAKLNELNGGSPASNSPYAGWRYNVSNSSLTFVHPISNNYTLVNIGPFTVPQYGSGPWTTNGKKRRSPIDNNFITNYAARLVSYEKFNLTFEYSETTPVSPTYSFVSVYLMDNLPTTTNYVNFKSSLNTGQFLGKIEQSGTYSFYGLDGQKYLVFVAPSVVIQGGLSQDSIQYFSFDISNIEIDGSYSEPDNNVEKLFTNSNIYQEPTPLSVLNTSNDADYSYVSTTDNTQHLTDGPIGIIANGATGTTGSFNGYFSNLYGTVSNLSIINSKVGNGKFKSGIWENGVWNSGIRIDEEAWEFDDIVVSFNLSTKNTKWRFQISGNTQSVSNFEVGDKVSIANIVGIDINEKRKLFKNYFTITKKDDNNLVIEVENSFPLRRIEKDSENHKIKITKNVWLNGAFLNGYWENGIWNDGMFKGYPVITEIYNSHWIDGKFDGGHFYGFTPEFNFGDTYYLDGYVGLTFSTQHSFVKGDQIIIDKDNKGINPQYDGQCLVTEVIDKYVIKTSLPWGISSTTESGVARRKTNTSLIQNFEFIDNNVAKFNYQSIKQGQSNYVYDDGDILKIWRFNSWMDLTYTSESYTTLGKNKVEFDPIPNNSQGGIQSFNSGLSNLNYGIGEYSEPNLRGSITKDVLSSKSLFRDVDSQIRRYYSLGTKHEIYEDYIGESSEFDLPFNSSDDLGGLSNFFSSGWTYSTTPPYVDWNSLIPFDDNVYDSGKVGFVSLTYSNVQIGDNIWIQQYPGFSHPSYDGHHKITKVIAANSGTNSSPSSAIPSNTDYYIYGTDGDFVSSTPAQGGIMRYGKRPESPVTISRTQDATLKIEQPIDSLQTLLLNNTNIKIPKRRYSTIQLDIVTFSNNLYVPMIDPVEKITTGSGTQTYIFPDQSIFDTRFGDFKNYYYNRTSLSLVMPNLAGFSLYGPTGVSPGGAPLSGYTLSPTQSSLVWFRFGNQSLEIDNLKFYEIDAVPFFKYTTEDYVNKSVQIPLIGKAPVIDYTDQNFSFIESINIGLDSVQLNTMNVVNSVSILSTTGSSISFES